MSKQTNSAYPLRVIYKKGDLVEYDPETNEQVRSPSYADSTYTQVRSGSCVLNLKQFNVGRSVIYEMEYAGDLSDLHWPKLKRTPEKTQRTREAEWISATGEVIREDTFSFFGSPRTTSVLNVWIEMATPKSIEKYLSSAQSDGVARKREMKKNASVDGVSTKLDVLRKRLWDRDIGFV